MEKIKILLTEGYIHTLSFYVTFFFNGKLCIAAQSIPLIALFCDHASILTYMLCLHVFKSLRPSPFEFSSLMREKCGYVLELQNKVQFDIAVLHGGLFGHSETWCTQKKR